MARGTPIGSSVRRTGEDSYYAAATEAEAYLVLGDAHGARDALERAAATHGGDHGALATTRRQLRLVCDLAGLDPELISAPDNRIRLFKRILRPGWPDLAFAGFAQSTPTLS